MTTFTLRFDPTVDDPADVFAQVETAYQATGADGQMHALPSRPRGSIPAQSDRRAPALPDGWTDRRMRTYLHLLSPDGRRALRCMAEHAPTVPVQTVQQAVGITHGPSYAGMMSTFGHAVRNAPGVTAAPFTKHRRVYHLHPAIAALVLHALDTPDIQVAPLVLD